MKQDSIGGYFELELPNRGGFLHDDCVLLNSGRNALEYVLKSLQDVCRLWIPYYTCKVILEPLEKVNIPYSFYHIDGRLELREPIKLQEGECLLYTNYFGIKDGYVRTLAKQYGSKLIVDNAQAWYAEPIESVNTIYSPRKYVGIPDGGIACCLKGVDTSQFEQDCSYERCSHLLKRIDLGPSEGYADFRTNSEQLKGQPVKQMSKLTRRLLSSIDFEDVKTRRRNNFEYLHKRFRELNLFELPSMDAFECPMVYPYLTEDSSLKQKLIENKIFVATYWPNVLDQCKPEDWEYTLAERAVFIPIDQRYCTEDMERIIEIVF